MGNVNTQLIFGFYGSPITGRREISWSLHKSLHNDADLLCVFRDFNEIVA